MVSASAEVERPERVGAVQRARLMAALILLPLLVELTDVRLAGALVALGIGEGDAATQIAVPLGLSGRGDEALV